MWAGNPVIMNIKNCNWFALQVHWISILLSGIVTHVFKDDYSPKLYGAVIRKANVILKKVIFSFLSCTYQYFNYLIIHICVPFIQDVPFKSTLFECIMLFQTRLHLQRVLIKSWMTVSQSVENITRFSWSEKFIDL